MIDYELNKGYHPFPALKIRMDSVNELPGRAWIPTSAAFLVLWKRAVGMDFKGQPQLQAQLPQGHRSF